MITVDEVQARTATILGGITASLTIISCYLSAVILGHAPIWLPMISDCAVKPPEMYVFRVGMISAALLLQFNSIQMIFFLNSEKFGGRKVSDTLGVWLASIACLGLAIVGAVNQDENKTLHGASAVIFFFGYEFYMILVTKRLSSFKGTAISPFSFYLKLTLTSICAVALVFFVYFSAHWGEYKIDIAICEWLGVSCIIAFNVSYCFEYKNTFVLAALEKAPPNHYFQVPNVYPYVMSVPEEYQTSY